MVDVDTFLTTLYFMADNFYKARPRERRPGPNTSLSPSEVITLAVFSRFSRFASERDFYRYADANLRGAFPALPDRSQFNRLVRSNAKPIEEMALHLAKIMKPDRCPYEALDSAAMVVRDAKRRGAGWLAGYTDIGWSNRLGWYEGFRLLVAVSPTGVITGLGFAPASTADQPMAETFLAAREPAHTRGFRAWERPPRDATWPTRVSREPRTTSGGSATTGRASSIRPSATPASGAGPSVSDGGWPESVRSWRRSTTSSSTLSVFIVNALMS